MKMLIATICDAAADNQGKLGILGTFDTINARGMPVVIPLCSIALRFMFSKVEEGSHKIRISIIDEDGKPVIKSIEGGMIVKCPDGQISTTGNLVLNVQKLKFEKAGTYSIDVAVDGRQEVNLPLYVKLVPTEQKGVRP